TTTTAYLQEDGSEVVSLPYDMDGDNIADAWQEEKGVVGKAPSSDDEDQPQGDFVPGDGFTLWEEYRGFLEGGKHIHGDPARKDYFICDTVRGRVRPGILLFEGISKLKVHKDLTVDELSPSRVMNRNHADGPHSVDQHGILVGQRETDGTCEAIGGPGTPKDITEVVIDPGVSTDKRIGRSTYAEIISFVAHELLHACDCWHHGETDQVVTWHAEPVDGGGVRVYEYGDPADVGHKEKGVAIWVWDEAGRLLDPHAWDDARTIWLGVRGGQHSGNEGCVMRYDCARAYLGTSASARYYLQPADREVPGFHLCTSPEGTGVNQAGRAPRSRYGDATKGDCVDEIRVKDSY
ncbi:MAG: hypothetical protein WCP21_00855, partial [Armatimonadota bacterium]